MLEGQAKSIYSPLLSVLKNGQHCTDYGLTNVPKLMETTRHSLDFTPMHYAAIESNRELNKSLKVIALLLLIFGPNMIILFSTGVKP